jgi:hypothetical protein
MAAGNRPRTIADATARPLTIPIRLSVTCTARLPARRRHRPAGLARGVRSRRWRRIVRLRRSRAQARDRFREDLLRVPDRRSSEPRQSAARAVRRRDGGRVRRARAAAVGRRRASGLPPTRRRRSRPARAGTRS